MILKTELLCYDLTNIPVHQEAQKAAPARAPATQIAMKANELTNDKIIMIIIAIHILILTIIVLVNI